jgi:alkylated DNA repair dioxygenase AlkB
VPHWDVASTTGLLFDVVDLPKGLRYEPDFISEADEAQLLEAIAQIEFSTFEMHGVAARRRVAFFGRSYDAGGTATIGPIPEFLMPLRQRIAAWTGVEADAFAMALINQYPPGAPIGWHRDAPQYEIVAGVSLVSACVMKFRPYVSPSARERERAQVREQAEGQVRRRNATHEITLARRSAYLLAGESRSAYEHHIPPVETLRYSITFRTLRRGPGR